jgi:glycosyltransferase involved in cell wall biosynthesis
MHLNNRKRVLHFIASDGLYGAESVVLNLSMQMKTGLPQTAVIGCIVSDINEDNALYNKAVELGLETIKIVIANNRLLSDIPKAAKQLTTLQIDIIHSHGYKPSVYGFIISKIKSIKIMATCHLWFDLANKPLKTKVLVTLELFFYKWFARVVGVSEPIKDILVDKGVPKKLVSVVPNGVVLDCIDDKNQIRKDVRASLGLGDNTVVLINSGRLTKQKAQWVIVEAARILVEKNIDFVALIFGEGELQEQLENQITKYSLNEKVKLLGFCSNINEMLAASDCFVMPSIDEGMPMSLLEAVAAELPVISTHVGDIEKIIQNQDSGIVIPLNDPKALANAILVFQKDENRANTFALNAKYKMRKIYSSEAMARNYSHIYSDILRC